MSVAKTNTQNTMGVRRLMGGAQRSFRSSRPHLSGYAIIGRTLGDDSSASFSAGTPLDPDPIGDVYSIGTLPAGPVGYSMATYMPDAFSAAPQPQAPATGAQAGGGGTGSPDSAAMVIPGSPTSTSTTPMPPGSKPGGTFPLWLGIAILVGAAIILPPFIKKL